MESLKSVVRQVSTFLFNVYHLDHTAKLSNTCHCYYKQNDKSMISAQWLTAGEVVTLSLCGRSWGGPENGGHHRDAQERRQEGNEETYEEKVRVCRGNYPEIPGLWESACWPAQFPEPQAGACPRNHHLPRRGFWSGSWNVPTHPNPVCFWLCTGINYWSLRPNPKGLATWELSPLDEESWDYRHPPNTSLW